MTFVLASKSQKQNAIIAVFQEEIKTKDGKDISIYDFEHKNGLYIRVIKHLNEILSMRIQGFELNATFRNQSLYDSKLKTALEFASQILRHAPNRTTDDVPCILTDEELAKAIDIALTIPIDQLQSSDYKQWGHQNNQLPNH